MKAIIALLIMISISLWGLVYQIHNRPIEENNQLTYEIIIDDFLNAEGIYGI